MNPLTAGISLIGVGMSIFGGLGAAGVAKQEAGVEQSILQEDTNINVQRQQQAQLMYNRNQLQDVRQAQLARSMALSSTVSKGAQFGTALPGGYGQTQGEVGTNRVGLSQDLQVANNIFSDYNQINQYKSQLAGLGAQGAQDQGIAAIGGAISKSAGPLASFGAQGAGFFNSGFGPGGNAV